MVTWERGEKLPFLYFKIFSDPMHLSRYLKLYPCEDSPDRLILFSTKRASKIIVTKETFQSMEKGELSPEDEALLLKLGMIIHDRDEEKQAVLSLMDEVNERDPGLSIMVVLNLDCNFSCVYCYEGDIKGNLYMSDATATRLKDFIKDNFPENKKYLRVDFYGGEPLLSLGLIRSISHELKYFAQGRGADYRFTLVTNGSLFKRGIAQELAQLGLESVKITLDGPAEIHNKYRPFRSGARSFDTIIRNIKETCDLVKIGIGGNFDIDSYEKFVPMLDYLEDEGLTPEKIPMIKFDPVMKYPENDLASYEYKGGCVSINEPWLADVSCRLREEILKRGYNTPKITPITCMIEKKDAYVVNYDGLIYKCPGFIGKKDFEAGDLETGVRDYSGAYRLDIWKNNECAECEYLPLCFGGCRYMAFSRNGNMDSMECKKEYFDASLETLVKQDIKYVLSTKN